MNEYYGIKVKTADMSRSLWLSPSGTTRLRIHASMFDTRKDAEVSLKAITDDPRNSHIIGSVAKFT